MPQFIKVDENSYIDSMETMFATSLMLNIAGIQTVYVGMAIPSNKDVLAQLGFKSELIDAAQPNDLIYAAQAESEAVFLAGMQAVQEWRSEAARSSAGRESYASIAAALAAHPDANICSIAVPGEYARAETEKALNAGLHCIVFSNNVPLEDERAMKELAREKGLLCMGPDCGVANINGIAFVLASITNKGPFGVCAASGCGLQHVAAFLHANGSGVSQGIGTGGADLKDPVGGISMLMGIDALEQDPVTQYIVLVSRKPGEAILKKILARISACKKPVVAFFMGSEKAEVEASGAIWAANLDDCAEKALALVGKQLQFTSDAELSALAAQAIQGMNAQQQYVRGAYLGGTYCDEAQRAMRAKIGDIYSNSPLSPELKLADSYVSVKNCVIDYGEEEFTLGRPHPTMEPGVRQPSFMREANDPETAVILLDVILTPSGPLDPAAAIAAEVKKAKELVKQRGGSLAVVASVLGTDADLQNAAKQRQTLQEAGVLVCQSNYRAALLAGEIIRLKNARDGR